ncbi:MAG: protein-L-isoaspartate O-methyltransferase [Planctomycetaceae bacterium]|nr:protein-L-isoaspartate O-methyltransferase [Planctomycetaceae bacterium]
MKNPGNVESSEPNYDRQSMVESQLKTRGIRDERVLKAMATVPRELFVQEGHRKQAYADCALPIEHEQTISQPFTVACMCQALGLTGNETVLDVGTGSGYAAAVLSCLAAKVFTIERIPELAATASDRLQQNGFSNVVVTTGDGTRGWPEHAPYDAIVVAAGGCDLPPPYVEQLRESGRIVMPLGRDNSRQNMVRFQKNNGTITREHLGTFVFVPLIGDFGWAANSP